MKKRKEIIMLPADTTPTEQLPDWHEPFPEPNTMPSGWDLSAYGQTDRNREALEHDRVATKRVVKGS